MKKTKAIILLSLITIAAIMPIMFAQAQYNQSVEEKIVNITENAADKVEKIVFLVQNDEEALQKIETVGLTSQFEDNVTLYDEGLTKLAVAKEALANYDYNVAADSAIDALQIFREVNSSLNTILETAGIEQTSLLNDKQELSDAIARELQRIDSLRGVLTTDTPQEIKNLLDSAQDLFEEANTLLLDDKITEAKTLYVEAKQDISHVYQHLKETAEDSNIWRLNDYCERLQERAQERFRYGREQNIDLTATLASLGYQSETEFMNALNNQIQNAQNQQDIQNIITECQELSNSVQNMENVVNQEINRQQGYQGGSGTGGNGAGNGAGNGSGSGSHGGS